MQILEAFHHPYYATGKSEIQNRMIDEMRHWLDDFEEVEKEIALSGLTKVDVVAYLLYIRPAYQAHVAEQ